MTREPLALAIVIVLSTTFAPGAAATMPAPETVDETEASCTFYANNTLGCESGPHQASLGCGIPPGTPAEVVEVLVWLVDKLPDEGQDALVLVAAFCYGTMDSPNRLANLVWVWAVWAGVCPDADRCSVAVTEDLQPRLGTAEDPDDALVAATYSQEGWSEEQEGNATVSVHVGAVP